MAIHRKKINDARRDRRRQAMLLFCFFILFLLDYRCFYLFPFTSWLKILDGNSLIFLISLSGFPLTLYCYKAFCGQNPRLFRKILIYYFFCILLWGGYVLYSSIRYPLQPLYKTASAHAGLLYGGLVIPCLSLVYLQKGTDEIWKLINCVVFVWYILLILQFFSWRGSRSFIFDFAALFPDTIRTRQYGLRIGLRSLGNLALLYNFDVAVNRRKTGWARLFSLAQLLLGSFCLIFVQQTRAFTLIVAVCLAVILLCGARKNIRKLAVGCLALAAAGYLLYSGAVSKILFSFSLSSQNANVLGTSIRLDAIRYYLSALYRTGFVGNGFTDDLYYATVQHGGQGEFFYTDVGIFGLLGEIGAAAVVFYLIPLFFFVKTAARIFLKPDIRPRYALMMGIAAYLIGTSFTLIITDHYRVMAYPVLLAMAAYDSQEYRKTSRFSCRPLISCKAPG